MSGFAILGFEKDPMFRFSAMVNAAEHFGWAGVKFGVIKDPRLIGHKIVCARVADFGAVFRPEEVTRLDKTVARVDSAPQKMRKLMSQLRRCADDAAFATETAQKRVI